MDNSLYDTLYGAKDRTDIIEYLTPYYNKGYKCFEIGAGTGLLAELLFHNFDRYIAIEPDTNFYQKLEIRSQDKFETLEGYISCEIPFQCEIGICIFNVVNHIEKENLDIFFADCAKKLTTNGDFIFDSYNLSNVIKSPPVKYSKETNSGKINIVPRLHGQNLELRYYDSERFISSMTLNLHSEKEFEKAILKQFSSFERQAINGAYGDPYFNRYRCSL